MQYCNKCGKQIDLEDNKEWIKGTRIKASFNYGSNKDGDDYIFNLCDDCFDELINNFQIKLTCKENLIC